MGGGGGGGAKMTVGKVRKFETYIYFLPILVSQFSSEDVYCVLDPFY